MSALGTYVMTRWYRRFPMPARVGVRIGVGSARQAVRDYDLPRLALSLAMVAYGYNRRRAAPRLIYSTSIDTDQSFAVRVLEGRRPIARYDVTVDR